MRRGLDVVARAVAAGTIAWIGLAQTAALWWPGELAIHWTRHAAFVVIALAILLKRKRRWAAACAVALPFALWPWVVAAFEPRAAAVDAAAEGARRALTVAHGNLYYPSSHHAAAIAALADAKPDVVALVEAVDADHAAYGGDTRWPYQRWLAAGPCTNALMSRFPIMSALDHLWRGTPAIEAVLDVDGAPLRVIAIHPRAPMTPRMARDRDGFFADLAAVVRANAMPTVVIGDWNCTPGSPSWRALRAASGLSRPRGEPTTWPSPMGPFGIAIDHVAGTAGIAIDPPRAVWLAGSDHRGFVTRIAFVPAR